MTREEFRLAVFARDCNTCVICGRPGQDAHHIMERRLFTDGGYDIDNGVTVCGQCHLDAERTFITPDEIRALAHIKTVVLPPHLYSDETYDKWGNPYLPNGQRLKGELFDDESVLKALSQVLTQFTDRIKYPRTYHLQWSPGLTSDDRMLSDLSELEGHEVVVTLKMDGEQTTIYPDGSCHARSIDSGSHPSRDWVKALAGRIGPQLPQGWRICGENLWAKHSIHYTDLKSYFLMFSIWDGLKCLSWEETEEWAKLLDLHTVQLLSHEKFDPKPWQGFLLGQHLSGEHEGYVVRRAESFHYRDFRKKVGKYVRAQHVHTHGHWMKEQVVKNEVQND